MEIAGPGFEFSGWAPNGMGMCWRRLRPKVPYGQSNEGRGQKVMVEFVSANPTGPMHMGNARAGCWETPWPTC